jgi:hypothetical protein
MMNGRNVGTFLGSFLVLLVFLLTAVPLAGASDEGALPLGSFRIDSPGNGASGPVVVFGRQTESGIASLQVEAFGKVFTLSPQHIKNLEGTLINGLQLSQESHFRELGGPHIYLMFTMGITSGMTQKKLVTISKRGDITITQEK